MSRIVRFLTITAAGLSLVGTSCSSETTSSGDSTADAGSDCSSLTYATFGETFFSDYCASCHAATVTGSARLGAPTRDVFDSLAQIQAARSELLKEVVSEQSMPPKTSSTLPSSAERALLAEWLGCGAP